MLCSGYSSVYSVQKLLIFLLKNKPEEHFLKSLYVVIMCCCVCACDCFTEMEA